MTTTVEELDVVAAYHEERLTEHETRLDEVDADLALVLETMKRTPAGPWAWADLDAAGTRELYLELSEWVEWLAQRYLIHLSQERIEFAMCWYRHPVAVEMLTALMVAHKAAYSPAQVAPSTALAEWHDRTLWPMLREFKALDIFRRCMKGTHTDPDYLRRDLATNKEDFASFLEGTVTDTDVETPND